MREHRSEERPDPLTPYEQALRARVPSREALLAEAKAQTARQRRRQKAVLGTLAVLAVVSGLWTLDPAWRSEDVRTAYGQQRRLSLPDGSQVVLNSASYLQVEHRLRSRQFVLVDGEASFNVAYGERPFIVRSQGVKVRDIGTAFNVRSDRRGVAVSVLQGEVEVSTEQVEARRLSVGQQVLAQADQLSPVTAIAPQQASAWQRGKLRFDGTPLRDVIVDLRRYRKAPIRLSDPALGSLRLSGEFDSTAVEALIDLLPVVLPVSISRSTDGSVTVQNR